MSKERKKSKKFCLKCGLFYYDKCVCQINHTNNKNEKKRKMSKEELKDCTSKIIKEDEMPQDFIFKFYKIFCLLDFTLSPPTFCQSAQLLFLRLK